MALSEQQVARFRRDGYLIFPELFSKAEIAVLRAETARLSGLETETVIRERTGGVRSIFRVHEDDGATRSAAFRALVRTPRVLRPTMQALGTDEVCDGCPRPDMGTFAVMMTDSVEMNGALYVIPGSHRRGRIEPYYDESTSYKFWAVPKKEIIAVLRGSKPPVPIIGPAGTAVLFHCNLLHASGHNLSAQDRWHIYISFNSCANAPRFGSDSRPDWVVSRNTRPLRIENDEGVLKAA